MGDPLQVGRANRAGGVGLLLQLNYLYAGASAPAPNASSKNIGPRWEVSESRYLPHS